MSSTEEKVVEKTEKRERPEPTDQLSVTRHRLKIGKREIAYTATCGTVVLREETEKEGKHEGDKARAKVFFIAYTLDEVSDKAARPVTFSFNGGPGSSSVWLHLGVLGPRRVALDDEGRAPQPPGRLVDNEFTLLDESDLVFIDPVGTGYSRMVEGENLKEYREYKRDLESVGEFIRLWTTRYGRWASPKYLIGESYGTTRASGLSLYLLQRYGMYLNGVMLVSVALDFQVLRFDHANDLPPVVFLPTYAATAWYHKRLGADLQKKPLRRLLDEVEAFAATEYAGALFQGAKLAPKERKAVVAKLARYTGLAPRVHRAHRPAHRDLPLLQGAHARRAPHGRAPRQPLHRTRPGRRRGGIRIRSRDGGDLRRVRRGDERLRAHDASLRSRPAVRDHQGVLRRLGLEGFREPLRLRGRRAAAGDVDEPAHARARRQRLL
jgi:carboxypeptidase C (cathepsin A)